MNKKELDKFKILLTQQLDSLLQDVEKTVSEMTADNPNFPDPTDRASLESDRNFELRIRDRERMLINKVKKALQRIEDKTFGLCESCDDKIGAKRLLARPVTTLCIDCKTEQERKEKIG